MKNLIIGVMLLMSAFYSEAKNDKGVVVKILPDKLTLPTECEVISELSLLKPANQSSDRKFSIGFLCKNLAEKGNYFLDFRLNDVDMVAEFGTKSKNAVINTSEFRSYTLYEVTETDSEGNSFTIVSYCTKEVCMDLVGDYDKSIKESITSQLKG